MDPCKLKALMSVLSGEAKLVVIDFGQPLDINGKGEISGGLESRRKTFDLLGKCSALYGMCFSTPWHFEKIKHLQKLLDAQQPIFIADHKGFKKTLSREELTPEMILDSLLASQNLEAI